MHNIKDIETLPLMVEIAEHETDIDLKCYAIDTLGELKEASTLPILYKVLEELEENESYMLRQVTQEAIQKIGSPQQTDVS